MAEAQRFELWVGYQPTSVFKTGALNHSAKPPQEATYFTDKKRFVKFFIRWAGPNEV